MSWNSTTSHRIPPKRQATDVKKTISRRVDIYLIYIYILILIVSQSGGLVLYMFLPVEILKLDICQLRVNEDLPSASGSASLDLDQNHPLRL